MSNAGRIAGKKLTCTSAFSSPTNLSALQVSHRQIHAFDSLDAKTPGMLPAPHSNFLENMASASKQRLGGHGRVAVDVLNLNAPMSCSRKKLFGPIAGFLLSRLDARWSRILAELCERLGTEVDCRQVLPQLSDLVECNVVVENGELRHGSGLLRGQPLQAGWRRRFYVCPESGRLKKIAVNSVRR